MAPREKSRNDMELIKRMTQHTTDKLELMGNLLALAGIDYADISARTVLNQMFDCLMNTLRAGIPAGTPIPQRRRRNPKVTELADNIFRHRFGAIPDPSDRTLAWIEARIVEILNDAELRQLEREHNRLLRYAKGRRPAASSTTT